MRIILNEKSKPLLKKYAIKICDIQTILNISQNKAKQIIEFVKEENKEFYKMFDVGKHSIIPLHLHTRIADSREEMIKFLYDGVDDRKRFFMQYEVNISNLGRFLSITPEKACLIVRQIQSEHKEEYERLALGKTMIRPLDLLKYLSLTKKDLEILDTFKIC